MGLGGAYTNSKTSFFFFCRVFFLLLLLLLLFGKEEDKMMGNKRMKPLNLNIGAKIGVVKLFDVQDSNHPRSALVAVGTRLVFFCFSFLFFSFLFFSFLFFSFLFFSFLFFSFLFFSFLFFSFFFLCNFFFREEETNQLYVYRVNVVEQEDYDSKVSSFYPLSFSLSFLFFPFPSS